VREVAQQHRDQTLKTGAPLPLEHLNAAMRARPAQRMIETKTTTASDLRVDVARLPMEYLNLAQEIPALKAAAITRYRLSPHKPRHVQVANTFRGILDGT